MTAFFAYVGCLGRRKMVPVTHIIFFQCQTSFSLLLILLARDSVNI